MPATKGGAAAGETAPAGDHRVLREGMAAGEVGVWEWDIAKERLVWSGNMEAIHHLAPGSFDGTFDSFARDIHPDDRERVLMAVRQAVAKGDRYAVQYRLPPGPLNSIRWIEARGRVVRAGDGRALRMTGICQEITTHKETEAELALRARQQEAVAQLGERALAGATQDELFAEAVAVVTELAEADFADILELSQGRDTLVLRAGYGWSDDLTGRPAATSDADTQIGATLRSRSPVVVTDYTTDERFRLSDRLAAHDIQSGASVAIGGSGEGTPFGALAVYCKRVRCISPTDLRFLQSVANVLGSAIRATQDLERRELLIGELRHRVGNLFSLVQALHRQTGQNAQDAADLEMKFGARLASLASAHAMILDGGWQKTSLRGLLETALAPYIERIVFSGEDVRVPADAAFSFSMALHELATNANKYGALSTEHGRLFIDTGTKPDALGQKLVLVWKERDGPPPPEAETEGFGSKLIAQVVERQLGGHVTREVEPDGLRFILEFPIK
ncbi:MAG TPA: HWE histidine kinase domain-containing protein [Propylenella sp.]|nr:HWE histidine kinase domain-containing protein [Propylenella sp.]